MLLGTFISLLLLLVPAGTFTTASATAHDAPPTASPRAARAAAAPLTCAVQRASLRLCAARTDNYKDCYNEPDGLPETRSWLNWNQLVALKARYRKVSGTPQFGDVVEVRRISGNRHMPRHAWVRVRALTDNVKLLNLRVGPPDNLWGPLLDLDDRDALRDNYVRIEITLQRSSGRVAARTTASYRYDADLAAAPAGNPEYNGPRGRWFVSGQRTPTDVDLGAVHHCT